MINNYNYILITAHQVSNKLQQNGQQIVGIIPIMYCSYKGQMSQNALLKLPQGLFFFINFDSLHFIT